VTLYDLCALGVRLALRCDANGSKEALDRQYGSMLRGSGAPRADDAAYVIEADGASFLLRPAGGQPQPVADEGELLDVLEEHVQIDLQQRRPDLLFVHAAVVGRFGRAAMIVGASGQGKSTAAWALSRRGFTYFSDEIAAIDLRGPDVHPYARGLLLKQMPPGGSLPEATLETSRGYCIPAAALAGGVAGGPAPLAALFFLAARGGDESMVRRIGTAEGAARLYANALNLLAHPADGLDAAVRIADAVPSFLIDTADLDRTADVVSSALQPQHAAHRRD
jgi:hypothetical protein